MRWFQKNPVIEVIAMVAGEKLPWRRDAALVFVKNGRGALRWQMREAASDGQIRELMLGETSLLFSKADEYWCPTCEKLLALGLGRDAVAPEILDAVRAASNRAEQPPQVLAQEIGAVLGLLQSGVYLVSTVSHFPTDGDGSPFWRLKRRYASFAASKDWFFSDLGLCELSRPCLGKPPLWPTSTLRRPPLAALTSVHPMRRSTPTPATPRC